MGTVCGAIDLNPVGNTACTVGPTGGFDAGDIQSTATSPLNAPFNINVVVDRIPTGSAPDGDSGGLFGVGFELIFNPAFIQVTAGSAGPGNVLHASSNTAGCGAPGTNPSILDVFDGAPDTDGSFRADTIDLSGFEESPTGRVTTIQIECIAAGTSTLTLTDTSTGGGNNMGVLGDSGAVVYSDGVSFPYVEYEATVNCVPGATFGAARVASAGLAADRRPQARRLTATESLSRRRERKRSLLPYALGAGSHR